MPDSCPTPARLLAEKLRFHGVLREPYPAPPKKFKNPQSLVPCGFEGSLLVGAEGFEPPTPSASRRCSPPELRAHLNTYILICTYASIIPHEHTTGQAQFLEIVAPSKIVIHKNKSRSQDTQDYHCEQARHI